MGFIDLDSYHLFSCRGYDITGLFGVHITLLTHSSTPPRSDGNYQSQMQMFDGPYVENRKHLNSFYFRGKH